jgi:N-acetylmuramoyl-L-alanine amidase
VQRLPSFLNILGQTVRQIGLVIVVGMTLATIFTLWTPGNFSPAALVSQLAGVLDFQRVESVSTPLPPTPSPISELPLVGLVSGHKGNDAGAVCPDGLTEAQVNYDIALRVKAGLEANGFHVDLLDEFDPRLEAYQALALVSIHNDSCEYVNDLATGYKVAGALESRARDKSARLAACLTDRYATATGMSFHANTVTRDMTQYHSFYEIADTTPAAIIETGFLNLDRKILTEEPHRVAQGVIDGIICYARGEPVAPARPTP